MKERQTRVKERVVRLETGGGVVQAFRDEAIGQGRQGRRRREPERGGEGRLTPVRPQSGIVTLAFQGITMSLPSIYTPANGSRVWSPI